LIDVMATCVDVAGATYPKKRGGKDVKPMEGKSLRPIFEGKTREGHEAIYWEHEGNRAVRMGKWKLHVARSNVPAYSPEPKVGFYNLRLINPELYNIDTDPEEAEDVSAQNPTVVADIQKRIAQLLPTLPTQVQTAWRDTQNRKVNPNEPGAWPTPILP